MQHSRHPRRVENYTNAFLGTCLVILFMGLWVIASTFGFVGVMLTTAALDLVIKGVLLRR